jgi:hypothetical protein
VFLFFFFVSGGGGGGGGGSYFVFDINFSVCVALKKKNNVTGLLLTWEILLHRENIFDVVKFCLFMLPASIL